jgi:hypothetical protein
VSSELVGAGDEFEIHLYSGWTVGTYLGDGMVRWSTGITSDRGAWSAQCIASKLADGTARRVAPPHAPDPWVVTAGSRWLSSKDELVVVERIEASAHRALLNPNGYMSLLDDGTPTFPWVASERTGWRPEALEDVAQQGAAVAGPVASDSTVEPPPSLPAGPQPPPAGSTMARWVDYIAAYTARRAAPAQALRTPPGLSPADISSLVAARTQPEARLAPRGTSEAELAALARGRR